MNAGGNPAIVVDDLLSFVSHKREIISHGVLLTSMEDFYSVSTGQASLKKLLSSLTRKRRYLKILGHLEEPNVFQAILTFIGLIDERDLPTFVCKNLGNIPIVPKQKAIEKAELLDEHKMMKNQINEFHLMIHELKDNLIHVSEQPSTSFSHQSKPTDLQFKDIQDKIVALSSSDQNLLQQHVDIKQQINELLVVVNDIKNVISSSKKEQAAPKRKASQIPSDTSHSEPKKMCVEATTSKITTEETSLNTVNTFDIIEKISENTNPISPTAKDTEESTNVSTDCKIVRVENIVDETIGHLTIYKCSCSFSSNDQPTFNRHSCSDSSRDSSQITENVQTANFTGNEQLLPACPICDAVFLRKNNLRIHIKTHENKDFRCPGCEARFSVSNWLSHVKVCILGNDYRKFKHYCSICDSIYGNSSLLKFHQSLHEETRDFVCSICEFRFITEKALNAHLKSHANRRDFAKCCFCPLSFIRTRINDHLRSHTGERPYKCRICGVFISSAGRLAKHMKNHETNEQNRGKKFSCDDCGNSYKTYEAMKSHITSTHINNYPLKCSVCGKGFPDGRSLSQHHQIKHLEIIDHYPCPFSKCSYKAKNAGILGAHINVHTQSRPFKCKHCDYAANHNSYLTWHIRSFHPDAVDEDLES